MHHITIHMFDLTEGYNILLAKTALATIALELHLMSLPLTKKMVLYESIKSIDEAIPAGQSATIAQLKISALL